MISHRFLIFGAFGVLAFLAIALFVAQENRRYLGGEVHTAETPRAKRQQELPITLQGPVASALSGVTISSHVCSSSTVKGGAMCYSAAPFAFTGTTIQLK